MNNKTQTIILAYLSKINPKWVTIGFLATLIVIAIVIYYFDLIPGIKTQHLQNKLKNKKHSKRNFRAVDPLQQAVEELIKALQDKNPQVRYSAARALGKIGLKAQRAIPDLVKTTKDQRILVKSEAIYALSKILKACGKPQLPLFLTFMHHSEDEVRLAAITALGEIGAKARSTVPALISLARDPNHFVRQAVMHSLSKIDPKSVDIVTILTTAIADDNDIVRTAAIESLSKMSIAQINQQIVKKLIEVLEDDFGDAKYAAIATLGTMGKKAYSAVPTLICYLQYSDTRLEVVKALAKMGKDNQDITIFLIQALNNQNDRIRSIVAQILGKINSPLVIPALIKSLSDPYVKDDAAKSLRKIGEKAIPHLIDFLEKNQHRELRQQVIEILGEVGSPLGMKGLLGCLMDQDKDVRFNAALALGKLYSIE